MTPREMVVGLAQSIRAEVRPHLGAWHSRSVSGTAASGDATFAIDDVAENAIAAYVEQNRLPVAYYSEDKGLIEFGATPDFVLIVDPIDGTRPAVAGFESCVVSVALANYSTDLTMRSIQSGCLAEIKGGDIFFAERGKGAEWISEGARQPVRLLPITTIDTAPLSFEAVARPFEWLGPALSQVVTPASLKGGCFLFNSTAYSLSRLLTGQLAAVLDIGSRILRDYPAARPRFIEAGHGRPVALYTYDIAAAALIAQEAGAVVTNAYGEPFDDVPLLDTSEQNLQSIIAASTSQLHENLLEAVAAGVEQLNIV